MKVLKDFNTETRRFRAGMDVTADDFNGALRLSDWQSAGYIESDSPSADGVSDAVAGAEGSTQIGDDLGQD